MISAAMDEAMTYRGGRRQVKLIEGSESCLHGRLVVREVAVRLCQNVLVCATDPEAPVSQTNALHRAAGEQRFCCVVEPVQGKLQRGRATVEAEDDMVGRHRSRPPAGRAAPRWPEAPNATRCAGTTGSSCSV